MNSELERAAGVNPAPGSRAQTFARFTLLLALLAVAAGTFVYLGGWLTPGGLTAARFADVFQAVDGLHPGFRRNHAKGLCVAGYFESNGAGAAISKAAVFAPGRTPVVGRFSLGGGMPFQPDTPGQVRGLGLEFDTSGKIWRTAMINLPVFPLKTPQAFYDRMVALIPDPSTGKPDPAKMKAFLDAHPETIAAIQIIKASQPAPGFAETFFRSLNAFIFTNAQGVSCPVRWVLASAQPSPKSAWDDPPQTRDVNYLFDDLIAQIIRHPLKWHLMLIIGQPGDPTSDATLPWPDSRQQIDAGTLTIDRVQAEESTSTALLNFDPLVLPDGILPSDDPLLERPIGSLFRFVHSPLG